ncbi:MFS transporter [Sphingopyxis sp. KK2]|uniref:MFS transporter n=1 Tax=Sphingopyxis sp. KK2 TaxID=1855727 RepID=UPI001181A933|nr:MFS transporter [Sphingopyxis sp. KK2]
MTESGPWAAGGESGEPATACEVATGVKADLPHPAVRTPNARDAYLSKVRPQSDRATVLLLCAGLIWTLGILPTNILPTVLELLREGMKLNESQMGSVGSAYVLGHGIVIAAGPLWLRRVNVMTSSAAALLVAAGSLLFISFFSDLSSLVAGWFVIGLSTGFAATPAFAILGDTPNPTRTYSLAIFGSTLIATLISFAMPGIGIVQTFLMGAILFAISTPLALGLGRRLLSSDAAHASHVQQDRLSARMLAAPLLAMVAGAIFLGVSWGGIYNFVGVIGVANGMEVNGAGALVAAGLIGSLVGGIAPALIGRRLGSPITMITVAMAAVVLTYPALTFRQPDVFIAALAIQGAFVTAAYAYLLGIARELDRSGRIFVAFPAIHALGTAGGTKFTGWFLTHWSVEAFLSVGGALILLSWIILFCAHYCNLAPLRTAQADFGKVTP